MNCDLSLNTDPSREISCYSKETKKKKKNHQIPINSTKTKGERKHGYHRVSMEDVNS